MNDSRMRITAAALFLSVAFIPSAGKAGSGSRVPDLEVYAGIYFPAEDEDINPDEDLTYGVRAGWEFNRSWGVQLSLGHFETTIGLVGVDIDLESWLVDLSFQAVNVNPESGTALVLYGGPGWTTQEVRGGGIRADDDSLSLHIGLGGKIPLRGSAYLRPDLRGRWFEQSDTNDLDWELTIALGYRFGRGGKDRAPVRSR